MNTSKIIRGIVNSMGYTITSAITQWDYGYVFVPEFEDGYRKAIKTINGTYTA